jgi:hypothetical protein
MKGRKKPLKEKPLRHECAQLSLPLDFLLLFLLY